MSSPRATLGGIAFCLWLVLTGCRIGPDYRKPQALTLQPLPTQFAGEPGGTNATWGPAEPVAHLPRGAWWSIFADAKLDWLETIANTNNQQLAAAVARFDQAQALVRIARADLLPQVDSAASYTRQRTSFNQPQSGRAAGISPTFNTFTAQLAAGWEADVWGRVRRQVEAARANLEASADDLGAVKLALQAEIATDYFTLRALDAEYELLLRTAETFRRSLELTQNRRKGGVATDLDVSQAETQLRSTEANLPSLRLERVRLVHALATLCGQSATGFALGVTDADQSASAPPAIPVALPSELLERRPDIAAGERRMAAANAGVGFAQTAFYPRIRFNGLAGLQSVDAATWFDWPSRLWAVGPSIDWQLFTGGRNRAQLAAARAIYLENVAAYRQTVLTAFQEVEDQIAAQQLLQSQLAAETAALGAARRTAEIANNRYRSGLVTYLEVATAQGAALTLERTVVQLQGETKVATVGLIKALGGTW